MSDSVQPYPWDFPGKNTGVGCHFLLQCIKVKSESEDSKKTFIIILGCKWNFQYGRSYRRYFLNFFINNGTPRQEQFLFRLLSLKCTLLYSSKDREMNVADTHFRCCISQYPKTCFYLGTSGSWWHDYLRLESSTVSHSSSFTRGLRVCFTPGVSNKNMNTCSFSLHSLHILQHCS